MKNSRLLALCLAAVAVGLAVGWWRVSQRNNRTAPPPVVQADPAVAPAPTPAAKPASATRPQPLPNIDRRAASASPAREAHVARETSRESRRAAAAKLATELPGVRIDFDEALGSPKFIASTRGFLATTPGAADDPPQVVKTFLDRHPALFGHDAAVLENAKLVRDYATEHNGLRTLVWQQQLEGIRVFESTLQAHVTKNGELVNIASRLVPNPATAAAKTPEHIDAKTAVSAAGKDIGDPLPTAQIAENAPPEGPSRKQRFRSTRLLDISAETVWLPEDETSMRLCWEVIFKSKLRGEMFRSLVDAETGVVVVRQGLTEYISDATYHVFTSDSPSPFSPGHPTPLTTQPPTVARTAVTTPALNTTASPNGWIDDGVNETRGNNVDAHTDTDANDVADTPRPQGSPNRVFAPPLDLAQAPSTYRNAAVVDLFYWNNLIHDRFWELGFTEAAGNFQNNNFGRGGAGNDAVQADAQDGSGTNNANFSTPPDGSAGRMQMYVFTASNPDRDGDFDHEIVIHEYTHGLSNRLVGGGVGLSALQSRGMGEGWSDFYALCLLSEPTDDPNAVYAKGGYATYQYGGMATNYYYGIRRYPYSTNLAKNPLTFKDINSAQASSHTGVPQSPIGGGSAEEVHNQGEVWCVALWDVRANLIAKHGAAAGNHLILQLVTDGMKLAPANPNMLQARDGIIQADLVNNSGANFGELWSGFAKRGMGARATSPSSNSTTGLVENYEVPDPLGIASSGTWNVTVMAGGPYTATQSYTLTNGGTASFNWTASKTQPWLALSQTGGTLAAGASTTVTASFSAAAAALVVGNYSDAITFRNTTTGVNQTRGVALTIEPLLVPVFSETWETGTVRSMWTITGTGTHRTQVTTANAPHSGSHHLAMDSSTDSSAARNEATLTLDLTGKQDLRLRFWLKMFNEEPDGPPAAPFTGGADFDGVAISANGTQWHEVQPLRTLHNDWVSYTVDLDAAIAARALSYGANFKIRFNHFDNFTIDTDGFAFDDIEVVQAITNRLTVTLPASVGEGAGAVNGTVLVQPTPSADLTVNLTSAAPTQATVPPSIVIPAGQSQGTFAITPVDDALLEGSQPVTITAAAAGYTSSDGSIIIDDNETAVLTVSLPANATETTGSVSGTVSVNAAPVADVTVQLTSSNPAEITVPASVTIPAGQTSAPFDATIVNDTRIDGAVTTTVTAQVPAWTAGSANITVADNESTALSLTLPAQVVEGAVGSGTVSIAGTLATDLVVTLDSSNPTQLGVAASATILAGSTSATFAITAVDDTLLDGPQPATLTANAPGFVAASGVVAAVDNDVHHFTFATIPSPQVAGAAFTVTITARDAAEAVVTGFTGTANLTASAGLGLSPATTANFTTGQWTGNATLSSIATGVTLTATHASGATGQSNAFDVIGADYTYVENWPTFGNGPGHTGYQPTTLGAVAYQLGWSKAFPMTTTNGLQQVAVSNGRIFVTPSFLSAETFVSALDASTGDELWFKPYASSYSMSQPTVNAGRVYAQRSTPPGDLLCLDAATGNAVWTAPFSTQGFRYAAPTVVHEGVWVNGGLSGGLYGFNTSNGSQRFFNSTLAQVDQWTPAYHNGVLHTWTGGVFRAHDPTTGTNLWSVSAGDSSQAGTPVTLGGKAFLVGSSAVYAIDLATRLSAWSVAGTFTGTAAVANGIVYVLSGSTVKAYQSESGVLQGTYNTGGTTLSGQPIVTNDTLIVSSSSSTYLFTLGTFSPRQTIANAGKAALAHGVLYLAGIDTTLRSYYPGGQTIITVTVAASASEGSAPQTGTITISKVRAEDTPITLTSGNASRLTVAPSVTIPAGQTSANFTFSVVDDALPNGSEAITITAKGPTYLLRTGKASTTIHDNEPVILTLSTAASVNEGSSVAVTLASNPPPSRNVTVALTSSDIGEIVLPSTVVIPAGQASVLITAEAIDDGIIDGAQPATLTAHVNGWTDGTATISVLDAGRDITRDWPMFGNGPSHTGYQPLSLGGDTYQAAWTANFPTASYPLNQVAVKDGVVYVTPKLYFTDTFVAALNAATGAELWRTGFPASHSITSPTVDAGKVYVQKGNTNTAVGAALFALDAQTGGTEWSAPFTTQWDDPYAPTVFGSGVWINGGQSGGIYGFNTNNGSQRFFDSSLGQYDEWTPTYYRGTVYSWVAGVFRAHDPMTGVVQWSSTLSTGPSSRAMNTAAVIDAGKAFLVGNPDLFAVDLETHATLWRASGTFTGTPATTLGVVYAMLGSDVKAYHAHTGALLGTYATGSSTISGQPIVTDDSLIVSSPTATYIFTLGVFTPRQVIPQGGYVSLANGVLYLAGFNSPTAILRTYRLPGMATLTLAAPASAAEGSAPQTATVTLSQAPASDTAIAIVSSHPSRLTASPSAMILAGQTSATFMLAAVDDALRNGSPNVIVTASGPSHLFLSASRAVAVHDNESVTLSVTVPTSATEGGANVSGTVTLSAAPNTDVAVNLLSSDTTEATVPAKVTVLAGQTSATFPIAIVNDTLIDGTQTATISASLPGWTGGNANINVLDNENTNLSLSISPSVNEESTTNGTVSISGTISTPLVVSLVSSNPARLTVPASVTIPAGSLSASFTLTGVANTATDGSVSVNVTATASGFIGAAKSISVFDNDLHHFSISAIGSTQTAGVPFNVSFTAKNLNDDTVSFTGTTTLTARIGGTTRPVTPATVLFSGGSGLTNASVSIAGAGPNATLEVRDSTGKVGTSNVFVLTAGTVDHFAFELISSPKVAGTPFPVIITAQDVLNNPVTSFNSTVALSAGSPPTVSGTGTNGAAYIIGPSTQRRNQMLYLASEVGPAGRITALAFQLYPTASGTLANFVVRLKHTGLTSQPVSWDATGWTTVYSAQQPITLTGPTWLYLPLTTTFPYNGTSNLLVDVSHNGTSVAGSAYYTTKSDVRSLSFNGSGYSDPLTWSGTTNPAPGSTSLLPNLRVYLERTVPMTPATTGAFVNGEWLGQVNIAEGASGIDLQAAYGTTVLGTSNTFNVSGTPVMSVTPATGYHATANYNSPASPANASWTLTNTGNGTLAWNATKTLSALTVSPSSGTLAPGASTTVTASFDTAGVVPGSYPGTITFTNASNGMGNTTRDVSLLVELPVPVLTPEPSMTGGSANTVAWTAVPGATEYEVQAANNAGFTSAVSSGWIAGTSYTFSPLADGVTYHYRVRARMAVAAAGNQWTQTTQPEFATGTSTNVSTSASPGSVLLQALSASWSENLDESGASFSNTIFTSIGTTLFRREGLGTGSGVPNTTPPLPVNVGGDAEGVFVPPNSSVIGGRVSMPSETGSIMQNGAIEGYIAFGYTSGTSPQSGGFDLRMNAGATSYYTASITSASSNSATLSITKTVNSTPSTLVSSTSFSTSFASENYKLRFSADGSTLTALVWRVAVSGDAVVETPIILNTGTNALTVTDSTLTSGVAGLRASGTQPNLVLFDDITVTNASANFASSGALTSVPVAPGSFARWGTLSFTANTAGIGTSLKVDVLDSAGALLAANVSTGANLAALPAVAPAASLRLRANLATTNAGFSPSLDDWAVTWLSPIHSGWSSAVSSLQDSNGLPDAWELQHGLSETDTALGDLDRDGLRNIAEYALCLDPNSSDGAQAYWVTREVNPADEKRYLVLHFRRRIGLENAGWTIDVQTSSDASDWSSAIPCEPAQPPTAMLDGEAEVVHTRVLEPIEPGGARAAFVRLRIRPL